MERNKVSQRSDSLWGGFSPFPISPVGRSNNRFPMAPDEERKFFSTQVARWLERGDSAIAAEWQAKLDELG